MYLMEDLIQCYVSYKMGVVLGYGQTVPIQLRQKLEIELCLAACELQLLVVACCYYLSPIGCEFVCNRVS